MIKADIIKRLAELNFPINEYWLITGGAMVLYGLRDTTNDIDLGCSKALADTLEKSGYPTTKLSDGTRKISVADDIEIFEEWLFDRVEIRDGISVISLKGLLEIKKSLGREKDLKDIELIEKSFELIEYSKMYEPLLIEFLEKCLPESGRALDINGRHGFYKDIENCFKAFWCMFDQEKVIGAVAVKELDNKSCELKSLYLLEQYHGMGRGKGLLQKAITYAKENGYERMYLDSLSTSKKAIALYHKAGFVDTQKYNQSERSDVFMILNLKNIAN